MALLFSTAYIRQHLKIADEHQHSEQSVYPANNTAITVTANAVANTLGAFSADIIAASEIALPFDIHWLDVGTPSANGNYTLVLYAGAADTEIMRASFSRQNATVLSAIDPGKSHVLAANARVRAKLMCSAGGSTCTIKVYAHPYDVPIPADVTVIS